MNKFIFVLFAVFIIFSSNSFGYFELDPNDAINRKLVLKKSFTIDDFEDGSINRDPEWWVFNNLLLYTTVNPLEEGAPSYIGGKSLQFNGKAQSHYVGGCGRYLNIPGNLYSGLKMYIYGNGPDSGILITELYDDDNDNMQIEVDPDMPSQTLYDDKFIYSLPIDWYGWKTVVIDLEKFKDENKNIGDDIWNPSQTLDGSGGLLQMQFVVLSQMEDGDVNFKIDSIKLFKFR